MGTLYCTKRLREEFAIPSMTIEQPSDMDELYAWHAHLFLFQHRKCIIVMNNATRYNIILVGLKKPDFQRFDALLRQTMEENLLADGMEQSHIDSYLEQCFPLAFTSTSKRPILGQMNDMIYMAKHVMASDVESTGEINIPALNRWLNQCPMLKLPLIYSGDAMREALQHREE